jgi:hypothetical protein
MQNPAENDKNLENKKLSAFMISRFFPEAITLWQVF